MRENKSDIANRVEYQKVSRVARNRVSFFFWMCHTSVSKHRQLDMAFVYQRTTRIQETDGRESLKISNNVDIRFSAAAYYFESTSRDELKTKTKLNAL